MSGCRKKKDNQIKGIVYEIDNMEEYKKSLGLAMLDILEKKLGDKALAVFMEKIKEDC